MIKHYLKDRCFIYVYCLSIIAIFYIVLYLYNCLSDAIYYASLLSICVMLIYMCIDYYKYRQSYKQLKRLNDRQYLSMQDLPKIHNSIEKQYQILLMKLDDLNQLLKDKQDQDYHEMMDYFTLWVHQIKTPISALELLIQSDQYTKNDIRMQISRIEQYVDMTLHYLKLSHFSQDLRIKRYDLNTILQEVIRKQTLFFIGKKIQLQLDPIELSILTDEKWISFVLEQILSNALKYTKKGFIHIYLKDEVLYIEDSGIGIKEDDLPRIFEKGFTGYNGRVDKKASGLGLYLCDQIVSRLGYSIHASSIVNQGTIMSIDFHVDKLNILS